MDLVLSGGEDQLLSSLQFKLPPSASYIQERRLVSWYPSGASTFSPTGVREARFAITGESWLDPASLRINLKLRNNSGSPIQLASSAHALIRRMKLMIGGVCVEDIDHYSRVATVFQRMLQTSDWCKNDGIEAGTIYSEGGTTNTLPHETPIIISPGVVTLSLTPLLGFLSCKKLLPLRYAPMQLYIEFADFDDALSVTSTGRTFEIEQLSLRGATVRLDSALESSFANLLMQNRALTFSTNTIHTQAQAVPVGTSLSMSAVRAQSRINAMFVTFRGAETYVDTDGNTQPVNANYNHECTSFLNPGLTDMNGSLMEWQLQIGSKKFPDSPATSLPETFSLLRQAVGVYDSDIRSLNMTLQSYSDVGFVIGVPLQTQAGVFGSGYSTRSGDLLTFSAKNLGTAFGRGAGHVYLHVLCEQLVEIREGGVSVLD
jgi:hypothetical protein